MPGQARIGTFWQDFNLITISRFIKTKPLVNNRIINNCLEILLFILNILCVFLRCKCCLPSPRLHVLIFVKKKNGCKVRTMQCNADFLYLPCGIFIVLRSRIWHRFWPVHTVHLLKVSMIVVSLVSLVSSVKSFGSWVRAGSFTVSHTLASAGVTSSLFLKRHDWH